MARRCIASTIPRSPSRIRSAAITRCCCFRRFSRNARAPMPRCGGWRSGSPPLGTLRFAYRGSGESGGVPAARRWQHLADDCAVARKTLARLAGQRDAVLLGLRLGATLALQETIRAGGEAVLALAPVLKGATQVRLWKMRSKIRSELTVGASAGEPPAPQQRAEVFDFDGFDVSKEFFDDVARIDLIKDLGSPSCPSLVMQLSHRSEAAPETVELMKVLGSRAKNICLRIEPFWENVDDVETAPLEDAVLNWLKQT